MEEEKIVSGARIVTAAILAKEVKNKTLYRKTKRKVDVYTMAFYPEQIFVIGCILQAAIMKLVIKPLFEE